MTARFTDHLLSGDHASRPAESTVAMGTLYACEDHGLIYKNEDGAWATWATLSPPDLQESVLDVVGAALVAGSGVTITVDDAGNTITVNATFDAEVARDTLGAALVAGPGVAITPDDVADTITISAVTDPEVVRDSIATALVAGTNVTIDVDDAGDTITINSTATGGASSLDGLSDVDLTTPPTDGQVLTFDGTTDQWVPDLRPHTVLLESGQTAADVPAGTPVGSIVFRKV